MSQPSGVIVAVNGGSSSIKFAAYPAEAAGEQMERLVKKNGQPVSPEEDAKQIKQMEKRIHEIEAEGAAGSIYVTIPVIFYGDAKPGEPFRRPADVILRRVNDVPGSTEAQRRWRIERIDWAG